MEEWWGGDAGDGGLALLPVGADHDDGGGSLDRPGDLLQASHQLPMGRVPQKRQGAGAMGQGERPAPPAHGALPREVLRLIEATEGTSTPGAMETIAPSPGPRWRR